MRFSLVCREMNLQMRLMWLFLSITDRMMVAPRDITLEKWYTETTSPLWRYKKLVGLISTSLWASVI